MSMESYCQPAKLAKMPLYREARFLSPQFVDLGAAKSWIKTCEGLHGTLCIGVQQDTDGLRVIDCWTRRIVEAPANCQYAVLSYSREFRWPAGATVSEELPDPILPLFQDALASTEWLGFDYLWIDTFCASREELVQREGHHRHIDKAFSGAQLTIVAACSDDASIGLSGVGTETCQQSMSATVGDSHLIAVYSTEAEAARESKWYKEESGYEECLLSRRRLLLTTKGLLFQCSGNNHVESYASEVIDTDLGSKEVKALINPKAVFSDIRFADKCPELIWNSLERYTKKAQLSRTDNLNTFKTILNKFASISTEFDHIWALPVYQRPVRMPVAERLEAVQPPKVRQTYAERLISSLVWEATDASDRRHDVPMWSWASSTSIIECEDYDVRNVDLDICFELVAGGKVPVDSYFSQPTGLRPEVSKGLYFNGPVTFVDLETPMLNNGMFIPVTLSERNDSIRLRHGLWAMNHWDEEMTPGRYLTLIPGASQATRTSWLTYHLLVVKEREGHYERRFLLQVKDADLNQRVPEETWAG